MNSQINNNFPFSYEIFKVLQSVNHSILIAAKNQDYTIEKCKQTIDQWREHMIVVEFDLSAQKTQVKHIILHNSFRVFDFSVNFLQETKYGPFSKESKRELPTIEESSNENILLQRSHRWRKWRQLGARPGIS